MPTAIIGIGLPGSGKTTLLKQLINNDCIYICPDDIRLRLIGTSSGYKITNGVVWREAYERIHTALGIGQSIIVDAPNTMRAGRRALVVHCRLSATNVIGVWMQTPPNVCLERLQRLGHSIPVGEMWDMAHDLEATPPTEADGFDRIIRIR